MKSMKKNFKVLAVMLAVFLLVLSLPLTTFAATENQSIEGDSTVNDVTLKVTVPTNLDFALDPLELNVTSGSQIATADYFFVNKTAAPVKVSVNLTAAPTNGAVLVDDPDTLSPYDTDVTTKEIYFAALGASEVTPNDLDYDYVATPGAIAPEGTYFSTSSALTIFNSTDKSATVAFALDKATNVNTDGTPSTGAALAVDNKGVAAFQFYSKMNTYADWQNGDITIDGNYTLTALSATTYSNYEENDAYEADGFNQLKVNIPPADVDVTSITVTSAAISVANGGTLQMNAIVTPENATDDSVTWSVENGTGSATISGSGLLTATGVGTVTVKATANDGSGVTGTLEITVNAVVPIGFTDEGGTPTNSKVYTYSKAAVPSEGLTIGFNFGGGTITSFKTPSSADLVLDTDYTVTANTIVITPTRLNILSTGAKAFPIVVDGVTYTLNITPTT